MGFLVLSSYQNSHTMKEATEWLLQSVFKSHFSAINLDPIREWEYLYQFSSFPFLLILCYWILCCMTWIIALIGKHWWQYLQFVGLCISHFSSSTKVVSLNATQWINSFEHHESDWTSRKAEVRNVAKNIP